MGVVSATLGAAVIGGVMQNQAAKEAMKGNLGQQAQALAFQEKNFGISEGYLKGSKLDAVRVGTRLATKMAGDAKARMADRGMDPTGSVGLGVERAAYRDAADAAQELEYKYGQALAAVRSGAEFPMVMQEAPQGMAGDLAGAVSGAYMANAMSGAGSSGLAGTIAGSMAKNLPAQAASTNYGQYMPF
jgi:hypothetical protein